MKRLLRVCSNRKSRRELLSTSEASWATTKSVGMWVFSLSSKATNKVPAVVISGTWQVAGVVIGFLLHNDCSRVMEKKLTNSGPLREPADKHSIFYASA